MRLEQLHYFEVLAKEKNFHKAAEKLHIAQPSLSASIKALEQELDSELLSRSAKGISLTPEGMKVLDFCKSVNSQYEALQTNLRNTEPVPEGNLRILSPKFFSEIIMERFIYQFRQKYPQIKLSMIEYAYQLNPYVATSQGIRLSILPSMETRQPKDCLPKMHINEEQIYQDHYHMVPLFQDVVGVCCAKQSPLAMKANITPVSLAESSYPVTNFPFLDSYVTERNMLSSNNVKLHVEAMTESDAYCYLPYFAFKYLFANEEDILFRACNNQLMLQFYLLYPIDSVLTAAEQTFLDELMIYLSTREFF